MLGDVEQEVVVDVEPEIFLRLFPERLILTRAAASALSSRCRSPTWATLAVEVRGAYAFGLFDVGGVERAIAKTVMARITPEGRGRADYLVDATLENTAAWCA